MLALPPRAKNPHALAVLPVAVFASMQALRPGATLGQYELVRALGSGGMGVVYEARHTTLGRRVAMKVLHARDAGKPADRVREARFFREGRAAAQVSHPNVVDVFDFGVVDGVAYLVMELVEGETLAERIAREGALPLEATIELMMPILSAVAELHAAGVVHRDLTPANILLASEPGAEVCPKVADFGVSRLDDGEGPVTESNAIVGTYAYMAPEQARAARETTELSDQYSLGVILYECVTGTRPFDGAAPYDLLHAILHQPLVPPSARRTSLPPELDAIVARAMSREPSARFAAVEELGAALLGLATPSVAARWVSEFGAPSGQRTGTSASGASIPGHALPVLPGAAAPTRSRARSLTIGALAALAFGAVVVGAAARARNEPVSERESVPIVARDEPLATAEPPRSVDVPPPDPIAPPAPASQPAPRSSAVDARPSRRREVPAHTTHAPPPTPAAPSAQPAPPLKGANDAPLLDPE